MNGKMAKLYCVILIGILLISSGVVLAQANDEGLEITAYVREISYGDYLANYQDKARPELNLIVPAINYSSTDMNVEIVSNFEGYVGDVLLTEESGYVEWEIEIEEAGLYNFALKYFPIEGRGVAIERELSINGARPFAGTTYLRFPRIWGDEGPFRVDSLGNEVRPRQVEKPDWQEVPFTDYLGYYSEPYLFYLEEGVNKIRLTSRMEPMAIAYLRIYQHQSPVSYDELAAEYDKLGYKETKGVFVKVQGEEAVVRSDSTLFAIADHGDPTVEPYSATVTRLNTIGGYRWAQAGQTITWHIDVPEEGLYKIGIKAKQDQKIGAQSMRRLYINNQVPFAEVDAIPFQYSSYYNVNVLGDPTTEEPYLFYLQKGTNELKLEVVLGETAQILNEVEERLYELNTIYRRILMITSNTPDPMRSYELDKRIPAVIEYIGEQAKGFENLVDQMVAATGSIGEHTELLSRQARLLNRMYSDHEEIPGLLKEFGDSLGALGTWLINTREQPLQIDYIVVASPEQSMPRGTPTFWQSLKHEISSLFASFTRDYDSIGDMETNIEIAGDVEPLTVWIGSGRDQAQILKQMIDDTFLPEHGIPVKLQLVPDLSQLLIRALIAGTGPDVAIGLQVGDPVNFGLRGALYNLAEFDDFDEVMQRFMPSSIVPFSYRENVWAIAAQQSFPVMFYRIDVLTELGLDIPKTWDDIYRMLPTLQKHEMTVGIGPDMFQTMLYQRGQLMYKPDGVETNLDSEVAIQTFKELTDLFTLYDLLITFNAENRFKVGEMPIVITDIGLYNRLSVFAPELRGEWGFDLVPGTVQPDGTISHVVASSPSGTAVNQVGVGGPATAIMSTAKNKEHAWEFIKWWTSTETQVRFGRELESLMGAAARYPTSNVEAFKQLPWSLEERTKLLKQWEWIEGTLEVPGGYYTSRMFDWAFRSVVVELKPVRETLMKYNTDINYELMLKRREFGLETSMDEISEEHIEQFWSRLTHIKPPQADNK